ncbi:calcium-binding protein [Chitinilyticum piscinae]|uniref:M10 family metallopeptidase C-terminal domain-containing protein n=1 Tax=Chitinilyticum piscinae TaxID=2866724 RepID=A0A8J7K8P0_9NEIS|nr:M10 family metallopeptidase C-terminal domain-containing protein [Chitinilyticum piscinae]MBE9609793.1 M10 family metallopeptidase C-terminal domain-containing protein [Chitinilyticum piscinae]
MAIATAYKAINMNTGSFVDDDQATYIGDYQITLQNGLEKQNFYGKFYDSDFLPTGTVSKINEYYSTSKLYEISGLSHDAYKIANYILGNDFKGMLSYIFAGNDTFNGSAYSDVVNGYAGSDKLYGNAGSDVLNGGLGNDILTGGAGRDILTGSTGYDTFDFNSLTESGLTSTTRDIITDFIRGQDKIDLRTIDANTATTSVNDTFTGLISSSAAFSKAGQLKITAGVLYLNTDSDSAAEMSIQLTGISSLANSDFYL